MISNYLVTTTPSIVFSAISHCSIVGLIMCNRDVSSNDFITVHIVPSTQLGPTNQNIVISNYQIYPNDTFVFSSGEKIILSTGDKIYASSTNGTITVTVSYLDL